MRFFNPALPLDRTKRMQHPKRTLQEQEDQQLLLQDSSPSGLEVKGIWVEKKDQPFLLSPFWGSILPFFVFLLSFAFNASQSLKPFVQSSKTSTKRFDF